jgi:hypothetical protein
MERRGQFVTRQGAITAAVFLAVGVAIGGLGFLFGREPRSIAVWMLIWALGIGSAVTGNYALWRVKRHFNLD